MADNSERERELIQKNRELRERVRELEGRLEFPVLSGMEEILEYLKMTEYIYRKWLKLGLPVLVVDGTHYAYRDNLKDFFKNATLKPGEIKQKQ